MTTRREVLKRGAALLGLGALGAGRAAGHSLGQRFPIGACDWSIGRRADVTALALASQVGLDGVQVSLCTPTDYDVHLKRPEVQRAYREAAERYGVRIGGIAIGALNNVPYASSPRAEAWVRDSVGVAKDLDVGVVLLAFFADGDIKGDPEGQAEVVRRLRKVAPEAEAAGVTLGIESWLSAEEHLRILDAVGSPNVRVYYDVANAHKMGYDIYEEIRRLGRERICEFHMKENGHLLGEGPIDFARLGRLIDEIGYRGWLHIEGAIPEGGEVFESYVHNRRLLREHFPESG